MMTFKFKRLKIVEQIIIVMLISVIMPIIVTGIVIHNINKHAIRDELSMAASNLAETVNNNIYSLFVADDAKLKEIAISIKYLRDKDITKMYLDDICRNSDIFDKIQIEYSKSEITAYLDDNNKTIVVGEKLDNNKYLVGYIDLDSLQEKIFKNITEKTRQVYVVAGTSKNLLFSLNYNEDDFKNMMKLLPKKIDYGDSGFFGNIKNQPMFYRKMLGTDILILVNTTAEITEQTINTSSWKIVLSLIISSIISIVIFLLYNYFLYINIRQLLKGIIALSKGNYSRKIRLLRSIFTPHEIVFLAAEFNKMAMEIHSSYTQLEKYTKELEFMDNFRSNLIDTVSHEFRTPLTSIKGYTSRLLRKDIVIDEQTINKSLKIIKLQSERLSRMVEDLLVIPDIEGSHLNMNIENVGISEAVENSILSVKNVENREIINNTTDKNIFVEADKDRFEQVLINLIENANKYAYEDTPITIDVLDVKGKVTIIIKNKADFIPKDVLPTLFEKFIRLDDKSTRTTRGTGLGLFIVKGLLEAMNGRIYVKSTEDNDFITYVVMKSAEISQG